MLPPRDAVQPVFDELALAAPENPVIQQHHLLYDTVRQHGIDVAYRLPLLQEMLKAWLDTDTRAASQAFLADHHEDLGSDEALALFAEFPAANDDEQFKLTLHQALLTLARLNHTEQAYVALTDPVRLQGELTAARDAADTTRLQAYATIGMATAEDQATIAQALFHHALGQALADDTLPEQALLSEARKLAPEQVQVWLGYLSTLLGSCPECQAALIALSQALLAPLPEAEERHNG